MNLAEIRKKALRGETQGSAGAETPAPVASWQIPVIDPSPVATEDEPPLNFPAEDFGVEEFPAPEFDEPLEQSGQLLWPAETSPQFQGAADDEDPDEFDPAAVILRGRETAAFDGEISQQDEVAAASVELLCFRVANEEYAISIMDIKEIIKPREVTEVPRVPEFVRGILSLRGNIIPIFDMRVRLGLSGGAPSERERVIVVNRQGGFAGVLVDEVVQVVRIPEGGIEPPPVVLEGIDREFVLGIGRVAGRMLILLDMEKVLDVGLL
ncbi:chemotaxis protein CheW [Geoanaerobacter pelophilus]|uniref:Chemotaxis protein CheW n=1 Tax=Geoanaerobacter pelophilus TaxID=60036 RepID=A0ABQ0MKF6_9BACT|nr:chemotaxis protein CheW [Geoanaerobacter pelophilus]GAW67553.1 chemotaxis protein CheW [Geoanaerobacter pelophilus]